MNCPECGTFNPEDRTTCWRCNHELPRPQPVKKKDPQKSWKTVLYLAAAFLLVTTLMQFCGLGDLSSEMIEGEEPSGYSVPWSADQATG